MDKCNPDELYRQHSIQLLNLIQSKVKEHQDAEDILHDSFLKVQTCCTNNCQCEYPKAYLYKIAMNGVADFYKKRKVVALHDSSYKSSTVPNNSTSHSCDLYEWINTTLDTLSPANKEAYTLVDIENRPQTEVAKLLGIPISTLKSRVQRTRSILKSQLIACCPDYREVCI